MNVSNIMTASGAALAATGVGLAAIDAFRLASGDISILAGSSFAAAFATHACFLTGGLGLMHTAQMAKRAESPALVPIILK